MCQEVEAEVGQQRSRLDQVGNASQRLQVHFIIMVIFIFIFDFIFIICTIIDQETLGPVVAGEAAAAELEKLQDRFVCLFVNKF